MRVGGGRGGGGGGRRKSTQRPFRPKQTHFIDHPAPPPSTPDRIVRETDRLIGAIGPFPGGHSSTGSSLRGLTAPSLSHRQPPSLYTDHEVTTQSIHGPRSDGTNQSPPSLHTGHEVTTQSIPRPRGNYPVYTWATK